MVIRRIALKLLALASVWLWGVSVWFLPAQAQGEDFVYTVQPNDTLILIALQHNLTLSGLILANQLDPPYLIFPGQQITLPGIPAPQPLLTELPPLRPEPHLVQAGETLFSIALQYGVTMGGILLVNNIPDPDVLQIGQTLQIPESPPVPADLPLPFTEVILSEPVIIQGRTLVIKVSLDEAVNLSGIFEGRSLFFSKDGQGRLWSIIAIHALSEPNIYPISLTATLTNGTVVNTFVNVEVVEGPYGVEHIQLDSSR